jgi:hypothetical protein
MKHFLRAISVFIFISCGQATTEKEKTAAANTYKFEDTSVINKAIIDYYSMEFQETKASESQAQFKVDTTEDGIELKTILDTAEISGPLNIIPFSKNFIIGDLNSDKIDDIVIPVYSTSGGSAQWRDIFVFTSDNGKLNFFKMYSSFDLGHCQEGGSHDGQFYPEKIVNGVLTGESHCYKSEDGHCCPSFKFTTEYKFDKGLKFLNQTKKE